MGSAGQFNDNSSVVLITAFVNVGGCEARGIGRWEGC